MKQIIITSTGFYDKLEERCHLLKAGDILTIAAIQNPAPCKGKIGQGI